MKEMVPSVLRCSFGRARRMETISRNREPEGRLGCRSARRPVIKGSLRGQLAAPRRTAVFPAGFAETGKLPFQVAVIDHQP